MLNSQLRKLVLFGIVPIVMTLTIHGQGTFQNLDFESAALVPVPGDPFGSVYAMQALPGWAGYIGAQQVNSVWNNNVPISGGYPFISIDGPDFPSPNYMQGDYYVHFGAGIDTSGNPIPVALSQIGVVAGTAHSVQFLASAQVNLRFAGQPLLVVPLGNGRFGADISSFAGQSGELRFEVINSISRLDFIQFSQEIIPEPGVLGLFAFGALLLGWRFRFHDTGERSRLRRSGRSPGIRGTRTSFKQSGIPL